MEELIAKRYAKALADASENVTESTEVLNVLSEALSTQEARTAILSPIVSQDKKTEMVLASLGEGADEKMRNFIKILGENGRLDLIPSIAKVLNAQLQKESNAYEGILKTSNLLDESAIEELEKSLNTYTGATIKLTQEKTENEGLLISVEDLGIEVNFSKQRVKEQLIDFIKKSL